MSDNGGIYVLIKRFIETHMGDVVDYRMVEDLDILVKEAYEKLVYFREK